MSKLTNAAVFGVGVLLLSSLAFSAVIIRQEGGEVGATTKMKTVLYLDSGKIRVESTMPDGRQNTLIFDGDKQVFWMIPGDGTYMEMTAASVQAMSNQMSDAMKQMQDRMASLPPEQRAMMEQAMKGRMGAAQAPLPTITFKEKATGQKFGAFTCTLYEELRNGERAAELCAASMDQIHINAADVKTFEALAKFMEPMRRMAAQGSYSAPPVQQLHGFPVHTVSYQGARATYETTVLAVEQKSVEAGMFAVPA